MKFPEPTVSYVSTLKSGIKDKSLFVENVVIRKERIISHMLVDNTDKIKLLREHLNVLHFEEVVVNTLQGF